MKFNNLYKEILNEIHYKDIYSNEFNKFFLKYNRLKSYEKYDLSVQFSNYKGDTLDKSAYEKPEHSDPVGNYAYPLDYILKYPADIWYGKTAKYLRVLRTTNKAEELVLNDINDRSTCEKYLVRIFGSYLEVNQMIIKCLKEWKHRLQGNTKWAKVFFQCVQVDMNTGEIRTGIEQTKLLLKTGFNVLVDESKNPNTAIINDREPNQILFLDRKSFEVVEVFNLRFSDGFLVIQDYEKDFGRKWASKILNVMGDKIKEPYGDHSNSHFYSILGREINLYFKKPESYYTTRNIGQKLHKKFKKHDSTKCIVSLDTEYGEFTFKIISDEQFKNFLNEFKEEWNHITRTKDKKQDWEPRTKERQKKIDDESERLYYKKKREEEYKKYVNQIPKFKEIIKKWSIVLGINFDTNLPESTLVELVKFINTFNMHSRESLLKFLSEFEEKYIPDEGSLSIFFENTEKSIVVKYINFLQKVIESFNESFNPTFQFYNSEMIK